MRRKEIKFLFTILIIGYFTQETFAGNERFELVSRDSWWRNDHYQYLGMLPLAVPDGKMQFWVRFQTTDSPGDYFMEPAGADSMTLKQDETSEIGKLINETIEPALYDNYILENLLGYEYDISDGKVHRREYHIYYARGDTIYVISGWLGKFLSFYRAIPGDFRHSVEDFQEEVKKLSPAYAIADKGFFKKIEEERNYFLEYVDKENMTRVRNYQIFGNFTFPGQVGGEEKRYNLIEITRFIDKEVIP